MKDFHQSNSDKLNHPNFKRSNVTNALTNNWANYGRKTQRTTEAKHEPELETFTSNI